MRKESSVASIPTGEGRRMDPPKRKLAAILSADVVGYSRLMRDDEAATVATLQDYRAAIGRVIERHAGRVVNAPGDNLLAEFPSAVEAVEGAVEIQKVLEGRNLELARDRRMQFRVGINLGDVIEEDDGTLYGDGVNIAARLEALAEAGGICISSSIYDAVEGKLDFGFNYLGEQQVKNIAQPVRVYRVRAEPLYRPPQKGVWHRLGPRLRPSVVGAAALVLLIAAGALTWQVLRSHSLDEDPILALPQGPRVAVLPFANLSGDPEQEYFADGITEEIIAELTRFSGLFVIARNSSFQYKGQSVDVRKVSRELGVRYVVEGSVRKAADTIRVTAQLLDAVEGTHLWAESYERDLDTANLFEVQDDIAGQIVATLADTYGVLTRAGLRETKQRGVESLDAYECILRDNEYRRADTPATHLVARQCLERLVEIDSDNAEAWARLSHAYVEEFSLGLNPRPDLYDAMTRAYESAQRAVDLDSSSQWARVALARADFFRHERKPFLREAARAVELNPANADVLGVVGLYTAYSGQWDRGVELIERAMDLSPFYPGWYHVPLSFAHYRKGEYAEALAEAQQINSPTWWRQYLPTAIALAQLGRTDEARAALETMLELYPDFAKDPRGELRKWNWSSEGLAHVMDGLRKAGLDVADEPATSN